MNLTEELDRFVTSEIESGRYEDASEVVGAALRTLEREERSNETKLVALRAAIADGEASDVFDGNPFDHVREQLRRSKKQAVP